MASLPNTMTSFSLRQVKLRPGEQYRDGLEVEIARPDDPLLADAELAPGWLRSGAALGRRGGDRG